MTAGVAPVWDETFSYWFVVPVVLIILAMALWVGLSDPPKK